MYMPHFSSETTLDHQAIIISTEGSDPDAARAARSPARAQVSSGAPVWRSIMTVPCRRQARCSMGIVLPLAILAQEPAGA
jgi:hypothetical protein